VNDTGIWRNRPTDARALDDRAANPNPLTMLGAYVSKARWGPLLQRVIRKWIHILHPVNYIIVSGATQEPEIRGKLTSFLKAARPILFFFLPFIGSSSRTRELRMCSSLSVKMLTFGKKVLCGLLNESGRKKPRINPLRQVNPPMSTNSQNQPARPATPLMWRIPNARSLADA